MSKNNRRAARIRRHVRVRKQISGTPERPRLAVFRSLKQIYVQVIDDVNGHTLAAASSRDAGMDATGKSKADQAKAVGKAIADKAKDAGIEEVVFDRGGFRYMGRVRSLAEGAREGGLVF
jgi:large subunit ribosomal protein L18